MCVNMVIYIWPTMLPLLHLVVNGARVLGPIVAVCSCILWVMQYFYGMKVESGLSSLSFCLFRPPPWTSLSLSFASHNVSVSIHPSSADHSDMCLSLLTEALACVLMQGQTSIHTWRGKRALEQLRKTLLKRRWLYYFTERINIVSICTGLRNRVWHMPFIWQFLNRPLLLLLEYNLRGSAK